MNDVNRRRVWARVVMSWFNTAASLLVMAIITAVVVAIAVRFMRARVVIPMLFTAGGLAFAVYALSELIVNAVFRAYPPDRERHADLIACAGELFDKKRLLIRPRLRILRLEQPNAMAYGWGILGQGCIGVSESLCVLLTRAELQAVLAHELAHLLCRDVGVMTVLAVMTGSADRLSQTFLQGKTVLGRGPFGVLIGVALRGIARILIPIVRNTAMQEREFTADALGALYLGTPDPLIAALGKLSAAAGGGPDSLFSDLFISHPRMAHRIAALEALRG